MSDQWLVLLFCLSLAFACSLAAAFFYQMSVGQVLRKVKPKPSAKKVAISRSQTP